MIDYRKDLSHQDLVVIKQALNEICNGIHLDEWDFQTRMGVSRDVARGVLEKVRHLAKSKGE